MGRLLNTLAPPFAFLHVLAPPLLHSTKALLSLFTPLIHSSVTSLHQFTPLFHSYTCQLALPFTASSLQFTSLVPHLFSHSTLYSTLNTPSHPPCYPFRYLPSLCLLSSSYFFLSLYSFLTYSNRDMLLTHAVSLITFSYL